MQSTCERCGNLFPARSSAHKYCSGKCRSKGSYAKSRERILAYQRDYYQRNKPRVNERNQAYVERNMPSIREYQREYRKKNASVISAQKSEAYQARRDHYRAQGRAYYQANRETIRAINNAWSVANREAVLAIKARYKHRRRSIEADNGIYLVSQRDIERMLTRHNDACAYCHVTFSEAVPVTLDHIVPVMRGGTFSVGNLAPACTSCNSSKGSRTITEWRNWLRA